VDAPARGAGSEKRESVSCPLAPCQFPIDRVDRSSCRQDRRGSRFLAATPRQELPASAASEWKRERTDRFAESSRAIRMQTGSVIWRPTSDRMQSEDSRYRLCASSPDSLEEDRDGEGRGEGQSRENVARNFEGRRKKREKGKGRAGLRVLIARRNRTRLNASHARYLINDGGRGCGGERIA